MKEPVPDQFAEESASEWIPLKKPRQMPLRSRRSLKEKGHDLWLLTLSDLLLLLMIFFVLLFGIGLQGRRESHSPPQAIAAQMEFQAIPIDRRPAFTPDSASQRVLDSFEKDLRAILGDQGDKETASVTRRADYLLLTFPERILFDSGKAELKPSVHPVLKRVSLLASSHPQLLVEVEGHTDDRPINTERFPSNWELSVGRATQVVKALIGLGLNPAQISMRGFGEYRIRYPNDSDSNRSKNRRVEIQFSCPSQP